MTVKKDGPFCNIIEGREYWNEEKLLAYFIQEHLVFCNDRKYLCLDDKTVRPSTTVIFFNCNDVFAWACAEGEEITPKEFPDLYRMHIKDKKWGSIKWVCKKRNLQPQQPIIDDMKEQGVWDEMMENLPKQEMPNEVCP